MRNKVIFLESGPNKKSSKMQSKKFGSDGLNDGELWFEQE